MKQRYLEVTFRNGQPIAAYLYLPREAGDASVRSERREEGLIVDFAADGRAIGIEITAPRHLSRAALDRVLLDIHAEPVTATELDPLLAA